MNLDTLHDAELIGFEGDDNAVIVVRAGSVEYRLPLGLALTEWERAQVGAVGVVRRVAAHVAALPAYRFERYQDQTLRRAPELDGPDSERVRAGQNPNTVGWRCGARPEGFRAPAGLIPGVDGAFLPDDSVLVTLRVPAEFVREAKRYGMTPAELLQGFAADVAGISNQGRCPRADGFSSNGSDEREMADAWLERAYAFRREDAEAAEAAAEAAEDAAAERDDFGWLLDDWLSVGGDPAELRAKVEAMIAAKEAQRPEVDGDE